MTLPEARVVEAAAVVAAAAAAAVVVALSWAESRLRCEASPHRWRGVQPRPGLALLLVAVVVLEALLVKEKGGVAVQTKPRTPIHGIPSPKAVPCL